MNESKNAVAIGTATLKDKEFFDWLETYEGKCYTKTNWSKELNKNYADDWYEGHLCFYQLQHEIPLYRNAEKFYESFIAKDELREDCAYMQRMNIPFKLIYHNHGVAVICSTRTIVLLPERFVDVELYKNYDHIPVKNLLEISGSKGSTLPADQNNLSADTVKSDIAVQEKEIERKESEIKQLEAEKQRELEEFQAKLEAAYKEKMAILEQKQAELQAIKEELEEKLFLIGTEIYAIRCYTGETIQFHTLKTGITADKEDPVVIYQKLRYLDVELGKYLSIYGFEGYTDDLKYFEEILTYRKDLLDMFCPAKKSVCFIRVSESKTIYGDHPFIANALKEYEKYHGSTIGILVRNGENLYITWTDEEKINLNTEEVFYQNKQTIEQVDDERANAYDKTVTKESVASRYFIYSTLQGMFDDGKLFQFPEKVSVLNPSKYIILSVADGWIEDNRFGTLADILEKTNQMPLKKGDMLLTVSTVSRDDKYDSASRYRKYNNDRGRGEANRTKDISLKNCTLYPLNHIDVTEEYYVVYDKYKVNVVNERKVPVDHDCSIYYIEQDLEDTNEIIGEYISRITVENHLYRNINTKGLSAEELGEKLNECGYFLSKTDTMYDSATKTRWKPHYKGIEKRYEEREYFISAEMEANWETGKSARANFQIFSDEFINLTYLNTVWLRYVIKNQKIGYLTYGKAFADFAYVIRYLNKAISYLDEREKEEARLLSAYMELYPEWQVDLSEWKMKHEYHVLTDTRAKRFVKEMCMNREQCR